MAARARGDSPIGIGRIGQGGRRGVARLRIASAMWSAVSFFTFFVFGVAFGLIAFSVVSCLGFVSRVRHTATALLQ